jgi:8-oxo-dGTP pyrophosphatase MutT (NUDIX family)
VSLHAAAVAALTAWRAPTSAQDALRRDYLAHLAAHADGVWKSGPPAHLTASAFVLDESAEQVLLTLHRKGAFWVQLGGHCEPQDRSLAAVALREAREESGLEVVSLRLDQPVDLDRHDLPPAFGRCRQHLDVGFVVTAHRNAEPVVSDESHDVAWWPVDALPDGAVADLPRRLQRALTAVRAQPAQSTSSTSSAASSTAPVSSTGRSRAAATPSR